MKTSDNECKNHFGLNESLIFFNFAYFRFTRRAVNEIVKVAAFAYANLYIYGDEMYSQSAQYRLNHLAGYMFQ